LSVFVVCFWGVLFPIISEATGFIGQSLPSLRSIFSGQKVTVGPPYYERANGPIFAAMLLLMGIAPLSAWSHSTWKTLGRAIWKPALISLLVPVVLIITGVRQIAALIGLTLAGLVATVTLYEFGRAVLARHRSHNENPLKALWKLVGRNHRRYGGYTIHLGVVLMALGIIGIEVFQAETQGSLAPGERLTIGRYAIQFESLTEFPTVDGRQVARATVSVYKDGQFIMELHPRRDLYLESGQPMTIPGVRSTLADDLYVLLVDWQPISSEGATFKVFLNPLVNWLWLGGFVFILGTVIAAWPEKDPEVEARSVVEATKVTARM